MNLLMYLIDCSLDGDDCKDGTFEFIDIPEIMRLGGCSEEEAWQFIEDAITHKFCDIEVDKQRTFHISSRRLSRDVHKRRKWREDKRKQREKETYNNDVHQDVHQDVKQSPPLSPIPTPIPTSKEVIGNDKSLPAEEVEKTPPCPQKKIIDLYHEILPIFPHIVEWDNTATIWLRTRWKSNPDYQTLDFWKSFFEYIKQSKFLIDGKDGWMPDLRWFIRAQNFTKIMNGNYHNKKNFNVLMRFVDGKQS